MTPIPPEVENGEAFVAPVEEAIDEVTDEIDEVTEILEAHQIMSENRHEEILERIDGCQTQLENLSKTEAAENPLLTQLLSQMTELRTQLESLRSSLDTKSKDQTPNQSPVVEQPVVPDLPSQEKSIEEPSVENQPPTPPRKHRFV